ncbi:putative reverse transcriptase domain-containing protein [Tanacetum coccineum]
MAKLTQKSVNFDWGEKEEFAFQMLKHKLCSAPILALPKGSENIVVYCDASHKGLGAVLKQREKVRSRGSDFDIPVVFSLIIALLRNKFDDGGFNLMSVPLLRGFEFGVSTITALNTGLIGEE